MAFALRNFSVLAYANGFTLWHYKSSVDDKAAISAGGFFDDARDMVATGDMLMVSAPDGARVLCVLPDRTGVQTVPLS